MQIVNYTTEELTKEANNFKELFLEKMVSLDIITKDQFETMMNYSVLVSEKNTLGKYIDRLINNNKDSWRIKIVKVV